MRLVTWVGLDGSSRPGAVLRDSTGVDRLLDLTALRLAPAPSVVEILGDRALREQAQALCNQADPTRLPPLSGARLAAPVRPGKILCLGYNYRGHVAAGADPTGPDPEFPNVFVKTSNTIAGPNDPVTLPSVSAHTDYEGEIAIVIARRAKNVPLSEAGTYIGGYTLLNDVSSRDWQDRSSQWELGKCFDGFCPLGPWITTPDEIVDPHNLLMEVIREGETTVSQNSSTLVFSMPFLVHYLSSAMTLEAGDLISTGSPQKLPDALATHRPLADGDEVTVRVAGLGELTTRFVSERVGDASSGTDKDET